MWQSNKLTQDKVLDALRKVAGPDLETDLVSSGALSDIAIDGDKVMFSIRVDPDKAQDLEPMRQAAERAVLDLTPAKQALVALTADNPAGRAAPSPTPSPAPQTPPSGPAGRPGAQARRSGPVPGVDHIIAVASGKGGVGKSTTTANLALGFAATGLRVGVLDADIYGPSQPRLFGVSARPEKGEGRSMHPLESYGIKLMSMGFLVDEDTPMIWRGPMVISALTQMLREVHWGELDVLVVDMPPGTGDAQLTMAQQVPLSGGVIVSTPQDLALIDARKGIGMFSRVNVPILGIIENMSYFLCPSCGDRADIFGTGGARDEAERLDVPFLGEVPLHITIRETSDTGRPVVATDPESDHAKLFIDMAAKVWSRALSGADGALKPAPKIVYEG
ncbi:MAG: Mrp/NBP35 family ATP-binding protein [Pseudomonadota bacterium]